MELDAEERANKGATIKTEVSEDVVMEKSEKMDKQKDAGESDKDTSERRKERSRSRSRDREYRADEYRHSSRQRYSGDRRRHHRDFSDDRHYPRYNTHIDYERGHRSSRREGREIREKESLLSSTKYIESAKLGVKREKAEGAESDEREPGEL